jgi:RecA-family ATPase
VRRRGRTGEALPSAFPTLDKREVRFRRGSSSLIVAPPGGGKSLLIMHQLVMSGALGLYFSADAEEVDQMVRLICITHGVTRDEAEHAILNNEMDRFTERVASLPIRMDYNSGPTIDDIDRKIKAFEELYGEWPEMVVVDNLTNVQFEREEGGEDPFKGLEPLLEYLDRLAKATGAHVSSLSHVGGEYNDGNKPIPLSGVKGQITRIPKMVLSGRLVEDAGQPPLMLISPVKNRYGNPDPSGRNPAQLLFDGARMTIREVS